MATVIEQLRRYRSGAIPFHVLVAVFDQRPWPRPRPSWDDARDAAPDGDNDAHQIDISHALGWINDRERARLVAPIVLWCSRFGSIAELTDGRWWYVAPKHAAPELARLDRVGPASAADLARVEHGAPGRKSMKCTPSCMISPAEIRKTLGVGPQLEPFEAKWVYETTESYAEAGVELIDVGPLPGNPDPVGFVRRLVDEVIPRLASLG